MASITRNETDVFVDGVSIGSIKAIKTSVDAFAPLVFEPNDHAKALRLELPVVRNAFSSIDGAADVLLHSIADLAERQLDRLGAGEVLTDEDRDLLHPDLRAYLNPSDAGWTNLQHPLVYSVPYTPELAFVYNARYRLRKAGLDEAIDQGDWQGYIARHERPYRLDAFFEVVDHLRGAEYWEMVEWIWTDSENIHQNYQDWLNVWRSDEPEREAAMDDDERAALAAMPDILTIYRGSSRTDNLVRGMSWTVSRDKAEWFARRWTPATQAVYLATAKIAKADVLAYLNGKEEQEIVVDPVKLTMIKTRTLSARNKKRARAIAD